MGGSAADPTLRFAVESTAAAAADHGDGGAVSTFVEEQKGDRGEVGIGFYLPLSSDSSACSLRLGKNDLTVSNVRAYFGRAFLKGDSKQFSPPSNGKTRYIFARVNHPSNDSMKLAVVAADNMNDAKDDLSTTYRLLYEVSLSGGSWSDGKAKVTVVDCRCIPQIPAYT